MKYQKKISSAFTLSLSTLILLLSFSPVFASSFDSAADSNSAFNNPFNSTNFADFASNVTIHLQGIIAFIAIVFIVIGGIMYMTSGGNQALATAAKVCITSAIIGLAIAAAGPSFLYQIKFSVYGSVTAPMPTSISAAPTLTDIVTRVLSFLLSISGILGILGLTVSGLLYLFAAGDSSQAANAKKAMNYSIIGIVIAGASLIIVKQIVAFFS